MNETQTKENPFSSIDVMARLTGVKITTKQIVSKWLLITYDIPVKENKARYEFLQDAYAIGATKYTESCYLMPWTQEAEALALALAKKGDVCVWTSESTDPKRATEITKVYDQNILPQISEINERLDKIAEHLSQEHKKRADKMLAKTEKMVKALEEAILRRGSPDLVLAIDVVIARMRQLEALL